MAQKTIETAVSCSGIGLHRGRKVTMSLHPAPPNTGIVFSVLTDRGRHFIEMDPGKVHETRLATGISDGECSVGTVEHVLAALKGMGVDNVLIEVDSDEIPIMDGSAASFVYLLQQAKVVRQGGKKRVYMLREPVCFQQDDKWIHATPAIGVSVQFTIDYDHPLIKEQEFSFSLSPAQFVESLSKARTYAFLHDVERMHQNGLALGGSLDNALVLDESNVVNDHGMRYPDEPVRHKVLDFIGDLALMPLPLWGHFQVRCSGHQLNNLFCRHLMEHAEKYLEVRELPEESEEDPLLSPQPDPQSILSAPRE